MARGTKKDITNDTKKLVAHLYHNRQRKQHEIAADLQISLSSVKKILHQYRHDTEGVPAPSTLRVRGRPRILQTVDFLVGLIERTPDIYLHELQEELRELCNVNVSLLAIWRALRHRGFTRKQVSEPIANRMTSSR
ncbi:hypothetical protein DFH07DRAFT_736868 [Mycena maculata]|uniref:Uncharacterized protein n=1 Tax=Mycena maculata TaxID=230809 RepID=A0AAD7JQK5_9AGAR|nr:hypothetical protein DFH07DRAFT_736868 [Mycena maculata]